MVAGNKIGTCDDESDVLLMQNSCVTPLDEKEDGMAYLIVESSN